MEIAPKKAEIIMKGATIFFAWNKTKYRGAIFCHVNKIMLGTHFMFLDTLMNHWCKGAAADLIIRAEILIKQRKKIIVLDIFS